MNSFVRIGLFPSWGGTWLYPRVMGLGKAFEYLFTGDFLEAREAEMVGVLNRLVPADELERVEPEKFTARGKIISLRSLDPTEEARVPRTIVVSTRDKEGDQINVSVSLNREDYSAACDAHKSGRSISVRGILERVGTRRRLMEPYNFRVEGWW